MCRLVLLAVAGFMLATPAAAQISVEDRPEVAAAALRLVADSAEVPIEADQRVWLADWVTRTDTSRVEEEPSAELLAAIQTEFPETRPTDGVLEPFLCPPGEKVGMPDDGCPIQDGGRILWFEDISADRAWADAMDVPFGRDVARVIVYLITTGCDGECTWLRGWYVDFRRDHAGEWVFEEISAETIT